MSTEKTKDESYTVMTELVLPNDTNLLGNLLGGRLLHWIDIAGALAASRHSEGLVATVLMEAVEFKRPIKLGSIVALTSYVTRTGSTSMNVTVEVHREEPAAGIKEFITKVNMVFVALDENGGKKKPPRCVPKSLFRTSLTAPFQHIFHHTSSAAPSIILVLCVVAASLSF